MRKIIKRFTLEETALFIKLLTDNYIEIPDNKKNSFYRLSSDKAELIVKFILDLKMETIREKILKELCREPLSDFEGETVTDRWKVKKELMDIILPFIENCNSDRLYKILLGDGAKSTDILKHTSYMDIVSLFIFKVKCMIRYLELRDYDDSLPIMDDEYINEISNDIEFLDICKDINRIID
jgi:hypothetical protein